jgi:chromosome segregation ATPase
MVNDAKAKTTAFIDSMRWPTSRKQQDGASQHMDQSETSQLQAQLIASEAERQRLQQHYDALSTSHAALTARYSQLEGQLKASQAAERSSSAAAAEAADQLEEMRRQLAAANRFLVQQERTNKYQVRLLHKALSDLDAEKQRVADTQQQMWTEVGIERQKVRLQGARMAQLQSADRRNRNALRAAEAQCDALAQRLAAVQQQHEQLQGDYARIQLMMKTTAEEVAATTKHCQEELQQSKQRMADMAAAVAAADAARRAAQRDEAAVLQAMAHVSLQLAEDQRQLKVVRQLLSAATARADMAEGQVTFIDTAMTEQRQILLARVHAAETQTARAQTKVLEIRLKFDDLIERLEADCIKYKASCAAEVEQAAADKAQLSEQVAQLRSRLEQQVQGTDTTLILQPVSGAEEQRTKKGRKGLRWLWQAAR